MPRVKRPIWVEGDIGYVQLTQGHTAIIDAADLHLVDGKNWWIITWKNRQNIYAVRRRHPDKSGHELMHRTILGVADDVLIDHISGNGLDNRRCNLRVATRQGNSANHRRGCQTRSGYKGVYFHQRRKNWLRPWRATISVKDSMKFLGYYATAAEAAVAYDAAVVKYYGEFGHTNASLGLL